MAKHAAKCPKCGHPFEVDTAAGGSVTCPKCQATLTLPGRGRKAELTDPLIGTSLGEFEVHALLGRGGMGAVYKGRQAALERVVAIKTLPRSLAANQDFVARFYREARTAAALRHTHLVQVYAVGEAEGVHYIVMEFVDGEGLNDVLRRDGPLAPQVALDYLKQTCAGLAAAHEAGIVHRDIKPSNLMIDSQGQVRITDFGLAKRTEGDIAVTQTGQSLGTPLYMAPEVAKGEEADPRSDLYSLGAAFYHLLAGRPPFEGRTPSELIVKHATETPKPLGEVAPHVDRRLTAIVDRLLRKNPASRYPSARALLEALEGLGEVRGGPAGGRVVDPAAGTMTLPSARRMERQFAAARHAERQRAGKRRALLVAGAAGGALLVAIALVAWLLTRGGGQPRGEQARSVPTRTSGGVIIEKPDPREEGAQNLFTNASKAAALGKWRTAAAHLARLDKDYANTKYHAAHRSAIADLRKKIDAKLKPKPATPTPPKPTTKQPPQPEPPQPPPADDWVSLFDGKALGAWQPVERFESTASVEDGKLVLAARPEWNAIHWRVDVPREDYELTYETMRVLGSRDFGTLAFAIGGATHCMLHIGTGEGNLAGLSNVDNKDYRSNGTAVPFAFENGRWYAVTLRVTAEQVEAWVEGRKLVDIPRAGHTFAPASHRLRDIKAFGLCSYNTTAAVRNIRLRRLGAEAAAPRFFHGAVRRLADGRVELSYDWSDAEQLKDWQPREDTTPTVADGELRMGARQGTLLTHRAPLIGDAEMSGTWCMREKLGMARSCVVGVCRGEVGGYGFMLITVNPRIWKGQGDKPIAWGQGRYEESRPHTFRLVRASPSVEGWIDGAVRVRAQDADYDRGAAFLSSWEANVSYDDIRIIGKLDPAWLAQRPDAVAQIAAAPLAGGEAAAPRFFHGAVRRMADGRVELSYDWGDPKQLDDWPTRKGEHRFVDGALEITARGSAHVRHVTEFTGKMEAAGTCCVEEGFGGEASAGVNVCVGARGGGYGFVIKPTQKLWKNRGTHVIGWGKAPCPPRVPHTFRLVRAGDAVEMWLDDKHLRTVTDPDLTKGGISLGVWNARVRYTDIRVVGKLDPDWLKQHPDAAAQIAAAPLAEAAEPAQPRDEGFAGLVKQIVAAGRGADWPEAARLLRKAKEVKADHPDVKPLVEWLRASSKPLFEEDFDTLRRSRWDPKVGTWRVQGGQLVCLIGSTNGLLVLRGKPPRDFVLTFDMANGPQEVGFRLGAFVRWTPQRHLSFTVTDQFDRVGYGGGVNKAPEGVAVDFRKNNGVWKVETGRVYRVAVRCEGKTLEGYLDGELFLRCTDEQPTLGGICLHAHRADARFDNLRLYPVVPLPQLQSLPAGR